MSPLQTYLGLGSDDEINNLSNDLLQENWERKKTNRKSMEKRKKRAHAKALISKTPHRTNLKDTDTHKRMGKKVINKIKRLSRREFQITSTGGN